MTNMSFLSFPKSFLVHSRMYVTLSCRIFCRSPIPLISFYPVQYWMYSIKENKDKFIARLFYFLFQRHLRLLKVATVEKCWTFGNWVLPCTL